MEESISLSVILWHSFSTWGTWANFKTPHDQALMLVAACRDFLTISGWGGGYASSPTIQAWPCSWTTILPVGSNAADGFYMCYTGIPHSSITHRDNDEISVSLVTAVALNGSGSTLQPLFSLCTVIYEQSWISSTRPVLAAVWLCRGFLILGHSQSSLEISLRAGTHDDAVASSALFFSLGSLCCSVVFVCAAGKLNRVCSNTPPPQFPTYVGDTFSWIVSSSMQPARAFWSHSFCLELKVNFLSPPNELAQIFKCLTGCRKWTKYCCFQSLSLFGLQNVMELTSCQTQVRSWQRPDRSFSPGRLSERGFCWSQTNMTTAQISVTDESRSQSSSCCLIASFSGPRVTKYPSASCSTQTLHKAS